MLESVFAGNELLADSGRDAGVSGPQLQFVNRDAIVRQPRQRLVPQVVPVKVDLTERVAVGHSLAASLA